MKTKENKKRKIDVWTVEGANMIYAFKENGKKVNEIAKELDRDLLERLRFIDVGEVIETDKFIFVGDDFDVS